MPPHTLELPAKRQSKWSAEEDALITELRGKGMKWDDISKRLPGRSAISCRLHYQNYLERRSEWDEERKNKLARLYERFKPEMWAKVAEEMHIPWRAAEAMHWQLGEAEMARRAGVVPFSLNTTSNVSQAPRAQQHVSPTHGHAHSQSQGSLPRDFAVGLPSTRYPRGPPRPPGHITTPPIGPTTPTPGPPLPSRRESLPARSPFSLPPPRQPPPFPPPQQQQPQPDYPYSYGPAPLQTAPTPYSHTTASPTQAPGPHRTGFLPSVAELTTGINPFSPPAYTLAGPPPLLPPPQQQQHQHQQSGANPVQGSATTSGSGSGSGSGRGGGTGIGSGSIPLALSAYQALESAGAGTGITAPVIGAGGKRRASPADMHDESKRRGAGMYPRSSGAGVDDTPASGGGREGSSGSSRSSGGVDPPVTDPAKMQVGTGGSSERRGTGRGL